MPPEPPPASEQIIEQRLVDCGLNKNGFTVKYEDYLQSIEIVISLAAGARAEHFSCIHEAVAHQIVTFEDGPTQMAYLDFVSELVRPQMLEAATAGLDKRGLLAGFPERASFNDLESYAEALEAHSGLSPHSALRVHGEAITFDPPRTEDFEEFHQKYSDLLVAIQFATARGDFKNFGFIGNEKFVEPEGQ
jgi:hypothetical protein